MATITSSSTTAEITDAYLDNCGYAEDASTTMAKAFITACTAMMARGIVTINHGDERLEFSPSILRNLIRDAGVWLSANAGVTAGGAGAKFRSFDGYRG